MFSNLRSLKGKLVNHFSHDDLDGYGATIISRLSTGHFHEVHQCSYANFEQELLARVTKIEGMEDENLLGLAILVTDIAPKESETLERLNALHQRGLTVVLLDHHDTNKYIADAYPDWAFIKKDLNGRDTCGTELCFEYLKEKELLTFIDNSTSIDSFIANVRDYDTWFWTKNGNLLAKDINTVFFAMSPDVWTKNQMRKFSAHLEGQGEVEYGLNDIEQMIAGLENEKERRYVQSRAKNLSERIWEADGETYKVGVVFGDQYHSTMGNDLHEQFPHLDFIAILDMNKGKGSLRTIHDHIHVGEISRAIRKGGGGHQKAAGFSFPIEEGLYGIESCFNSKNKFAISEFTIKP
ncbi:phosphoesterase [Cytobacillus oceanisediminis]|uniref:phosphoesterase n=1 Tax=Cytobacillus oceanisediminis TaxID=665099 RepID=UPI001FB37335|nr:phosphoesterase [Cytobacillus oceanisediminis]UOE58223.1 phosphoesterase [Cytobacillus oceanisediminis]